MRCAVIALISILVVGCNRRPEVAVPQAPDNGARGAWPGPNNFEGTMCRSWFYCIPYQKDIQRALHELRDQEFKARRFYRSDLPSNKIEDAIRNADAQGTRSILDIEKVSPTRKPNSVSPVTGEELRRLFGTDKPTRSIAEKVVKTPNSGFAEFLETYDRGQGLYIVLYDAERPIEILLAGWSCD